MEPSLFKLLLVVIVVFLVFGAGKLPRIMGDVAEGIKAFKKGMRDDAQAKDEPKTIDNNDTDKVA